MEPNQSADTISDVCIVGFVAGEGGLHALSDCLAALSDKQQNYAIVVAVHDTPERDVSVADYLSAYSKWDVIEARDGLKLCINHVYLAPPNLDITLSHGVIHLAESKSNGRTSFDLFLQSLAEEKNSRALAVVLSGSGTDGVQGALAIQKAGGYVIVQEPSTASVGELPTAAAGSDVCDVLVPPADICSEITAYVNNYELVKNFESRSTNLDRIFSMIAHKTGTDFSKYKPTTVLRRIDKRLEALELETIDLYYDFIELNPQELDILFRTMLIGVTEFFRDMDAFEALKQYLATIVQARQHREPIRVWCVGCATGEEAYTMAILFAEILGEDIDKYRVQIFATDIDEHAISIGRKGVYADNIAEMLPRDIIGKYFVQVDQGYEVRKSIRQLILFSRHDITNDPPFIRLDVISCRNLLIYFNNDLQRETLSIFHYALNKDGYLLLGKSESVGLATNLFTKLSSSRKIFQRVDRFHHSPVRFSHFQGRVREGGMSIPQELRLRQSIADIAREMLHATFEHPFVVVNENLEIIEVKGSLRLYTELSGGAVSANLLKMVNPELNLELRSLFAKVRGSGAGAVGHILRFMLFEKEHYVRLHIKPLVYTANNREYFIVIFEEVYVEPWMIAHNATAGNQADGTGAHILELTHELASAREHLQMLSEELETSNEELQALNEELQSANEELKASNEELETSNEELQTANEELQTANAELRLINEVLVEKEEQLRDSRERIEESEQLYRTLALNYPNGTINIIDINLHLVFIEGKGLGETGIIPATVLGKSALELFDKESREEMQQALKLTLAGEAQSVTVTSGGRYYSVYTMPLRDDKDEISRAMYITQDISATKKMELSLRDVNDENQHLLERERLACDQVENQRAMLHNLLMQAPAMIFILRGPEYVVELVNPLAQQFFSGRSLLGRPIAEALPELRSQDVIPFLDNVYTTGEPFHATEMPIQFFRWDSSQPEHFYFDFTFQAITNEYNTIDALLVFAFNITEQVQARKVLEENAVQLKMVVESIPQMAWTTRGDGARDYCNQRWYTYTGQTAEQALGWGWADMLHPNDRQEAEEKWRQCLKTGEPYENENRFRNASGDYRWHMSRALPLRIEQDSVQSWVGTSTDIDDRKRFSEKLEDRIKERTTNITKAIEELHRSNTELEQFAYVASHDLQEPLRKIRTFGDRLFERSSAVLDATSRDYLDRMQLASARMQKLIDDLLTFSRVSSRREAIVRLDLGAVIGDVIRELDAQIQKKQAVITVGDMPLLDARPLQMVQLFLNLIDNALKFSKADEAPRIDIAAVVKTGAELDIATAVAHEQYCVLTMRDNGIGFNNEHAERILVIFQRLHGKNQYEGTGIGLAVCKKIVENHNGFIRASGTVNEGAVFTVILPLREHSYDTAV